MLNNLTIIIPVKNDSSRLDLCLQNLYQFMNIYLYNIFVIDSDDSFENKSIAKKYSAQYFYFYWNGKFPKKRNWALENLKIDSEWVFFLDVDELPSVEFFQEVALKLKNELFDAFWINYDLNFLGGVLKYGVPQRKLSLFKKKFRYERIDEKRWSNFDMEIHEHPIISGRVGKIKSRVLHLENMDVTFFTMKHLEYAKWEASHFLNSSFKSGRQLTLRQFIKYKLINKIWFPPFYFFFHYIFMFGFLDGYRGLIYAIFKMNYFTVIVSLIRGDKSKY